LSSNNGDRAAILRSAIAALQSAHFDVSKVSLFYETEPVDYLDQLGRSVRFLPEGFQCHISVI